ncbi:MAG: hypothetical protein IKX20_05775 [Paludibacteraceae bacterium]|nr:hypothetical protein [Paludibacteraceae bacterium]
MRKIFTFFLALICAGTMFAGTGALNGFFTINALGDKIAFSQGNLQYVGSTWQFAAHQWDVIGNAQADDNRDLFGWGTANNPNNTSGWGNDYPTFTDWGTNPISNGGNEANVWRTLTHDEWIYLTQTRANATKLFGVGSVNGVNGIILLPDNWKGEMFNDLGTFLINKGEYYENTSGNNFSHHSYTLEQFTEMESAGAVFLPAAGRRYNTTRYEGCFYWSSTANGDDEAFDLECDNSRFYPQYGENRAYGYAVRLVQATEGPALMSGKLVIPSVEHVTTTVTRNDVALSTGDLVSSEDVLVITYEAEAAYRIVGENPVTVTLTDEMFEINQPDINLKDQGFAYSPGTWLGQTGWSIAMFSGTNVGTKTGTAVLEEYGPIDLAFIWDIEQGGNLNNGKFILTCSVNGTVVKTRDFTVTPHNTGDFINDTVSFIADGNDTIVWACEKTEGVSGATFCSFFVGNIEYVNSYRYSVPAPTVVSRDFQLIFVVPEHLSLEATINDNPFAGGSVHIGDELYYKYTADHGWRFVANDASTYEDGWTLTASDFNDQDKKTITPPSIYLTDPTFDFKFVDASSVLITWDGYGEYESYRLCVSPTKLSGNPDYWKGLQHLTDTFYIATGLAVNTKYYIHLEATRNGVATEWLIESFTMQEPKDQCILTIEMQDDYGDGWNGCGIYFVEGGDSTFVSLMSGFSGTATYNSYGETVQIVWQLGTSYGNGYPEEVAFTIRDGEHTLIYRMDMPEGQNHNTGDVLFEGVLCEPMCSLSNLAGTANGTDFNVTWDAEGADSYEVAVLQIMNPTEKQLDSAKVSVNTKSFSFTGLPYHGYNVFVRPVNAKALPQRWQNVFVYETLPTSMTNPADFAQEITLSYAHTGNVLEDAMLINIKGLYVDEIGGIIMYSFTIEDSTDVFFNVTSETISDISMVLAQDTLPGAPLQTIEMGSASFGRRLKGKFYFGVYAFDFGDYSVTISKTMQPKPITLDFFDAGDFTDADVWYTDYFGETVPAKGFTFTPTDTMQVSLSMTTSNQTYGVWYAVLQNDEQITIAPSYYPWNGELIKDSTYTFIVACNPGYNGKITDTYTLAIMDRNQQEEPLIPVDIQLNDTVAGTFDDAVIWDEPWFGTFAYAKAFRITVADTTDVWVLFDSPEANNSAYTPSHYYYVFKDSIEQDWNKIITTGMPRTASTITLLKDTTYYIVIGALPGYGGHTTDSFTLTVREASGENPYQIPSKAVTLDYTEAGDFTDATETTFPFTGEMVPAKAFRITPEKDVTMHLTFNSPNYTNAMGNSSMYWIVFRDEIGVNYYNYNVINAGPPSGSYYDCDLDSGATYYAVIYTMPTYGGKETDTYTLRLEDPNTPTNTILLTSDTIIVDAITEADYVKEWDWPGKIYEFVLTEDKTISWSIEYIGTDPNGLDNLYMELDSASVNGKYIDEYWAGNPSYSISELKGSDEGTHYCFAVYEDAAIKDIKYRIIFRATPDYDHLPVKGEINVNEPYQSTWSLEDGFHYYGYDYGGNYEAYQVALEEDKKYRILMHPLELAGNAADNTDYTSILLMKPGAQTGDYYEHAYDETWGYLYQDGWAVLRFTSDYTEMDTVMFTAYNKSRFLKDTITYEFSVEEVIEFTDLLDAAAEVKNENLPHVEAGIFADNNKVLRDASHGFHTNYQTYNEYYSPYDALARLIRIGAEDTLFVEFGGDIDATIQFYDANSADLLKTIDDIHINYPYENGYIVNETSDSIDIIVVCSFNEVILTDVAWSLRMSTSEKDMEPVVVTPKASEESITLYESDGVAEALEALSQIILTAVDGEDNIVATLTNDRFGWNVDVVGNTASYEFNDLDLPAGFIFANPQMFVEVEIIRIPDLPTGFINTDFDENGTAYKILRDGQVYIIRDGMVYTIMGQRVR